jgi:HK97 family phage portal protein
MEFIDFRGMVGDVLQRVVGTDRYTRMLNVGNPFDPRIIGSDTESWVTINNNEYKLYKTTAEIFIPVNRKMKMFSNGIWRVRDYATNEIIENHPLLQLLENPSPYMNRNEWLQRYVLDMSTIGNGIIRKNYATAISEFPVTLNFLPSFDMTLKRSGKIWEATSIDEIIEFYRINQTNEKFETKDIIHFREPNPEDPLIGLSPLHPLFMPISNGRGAYAFRNTNITKKGAMGIISPEGSDAIGQMTLNENDRKDIERQYAEQSHGVFDGQSPIKFSRTAVKYQNLSFPLKDSMLFEEVENTMRRVIDAIGLNDNIFSREKASTFSNLAEGMRSAYQDAIIPMGETLSFGLSKELGLFEKGIYVELDYSHIPILQANENQKADAVKKMAESYDKLIIAGFTPEQAMQITGITLD